MKTTEFPLRSSNTTLTNNHGSTPSKPGIPTPSAANQPSLQLPSDLPPSQDLGYHSCSGRVPVHDICRPLRRARLFDLRISPRCQHLLRLVRSHSLCPKESSKSRSRSRMAAGYLHCWRWMLGGAVAVCLLGYHFYFGGPGEVLWLEGVSGVCCFEPVRVLVSLNPFSNTMLKP